MSNNLAAFDPGLSGAVAVARCMHGRRPLKNIPQTAADWAIAKAGIDWFVGDLPTMGAGKQIVLNGTELADILKNLSVDRAVVEHVHAFPGQGVSSMFRFGTAFGQILGVLQALGIPYELVEPAKWKRAMRLPGGKNKGETSRLRALELFPQMSSDLSRKKDHNRAEALLMARWWLEQKL